MRGASSSVALGAILGCALALSPAAADADELRALAREKAAAVSILRAKAASQVAAMSADRVFIAYLNASTQGQGARMRARMASMFATLWNRFGIREIALVDRSGELVVRIGQGLSAATTFNVKREPVLRAGFAHAPLKAAMIPTRQSLTYAAPVVWRGQAEFVLSARQDLTVYRKTLARGAGPDRFVVLVDAKGKVMADTRAGASVGARAKLVAGMSLQAVRRAVKGTSAEGAGAIVRGRKHFNVSYLAVGDWTIVAAETVAVPRRCPDRGTRLCG